MEKLYSIKYDESKGFLNHLSAAKKADSYHLVMEGDDGGQIYLSCPVRLIKCSQEMLGKLLAAIDQNRWNLYDSRTLYFKRFEKNNEVIPGGMGGGIASKDEPWIHDDILSFSDSVIKILTADIDQEDREAEIRKLT